jgi:hypothetical protein
MMNLSHVDKVSLLVALIKGRMEACRSTVSIRLVACDLGSLEQIR